MPDEHRQNSERVRPDDELVMLSAEVLRDPPGIRELRIITLLETDREGLDPSALRRHAGHNSTGVKATRQKDAQWDIGHQALRDGTVEQSAHLAGGLHRRYFDDILRNG